MGYSSFHLYFDDLEVGQEWESCGRTILEADIINFAGFSGDFNAIHIDHEYAKETAFRRPIAHGFGVFSIASGLGVQTPPVRTMALLRVIDWNFRLPVFAGDTIRLKTRVVEKTLRGRGKRGEVVWYRAISNQDGKIVHEGQIVTLVECRPLTKPSPPLKADLSEEPDNSANGRARTLDLT